MQRKDILIRLMFELENLRKIFTPNFTNENANNPSPAQSRLIFMMILSDNKLQLAVKDIAKMLGITSSAATQLIDGLVAQGILERTENSVDRRKMLIELSKNPKISLEFFRDTMLKTFEDKLKHLTDEELSTLLNLVSKIIYK